MRRIGRIIVGSMMALSLLLCMATIVLWVRGNHAKQAIEFHTRYGLSELACHAGRFWFDNEPQRALEFAKVDTRGIFEEYELAREAYARSGRDLAGESTVTEIRYREIFQAHLEAAAKIGIDADRQLFQLQQKWGRNPPLRRSVPCGIPALASGLPPGIWLVRAAMFRRRRTLRRKNNLCVTCGYDLRASTGRCPECGSPIAGPIT